MTRPPIRVLIVDDSAIVRGLLARAIDDNPEITLAGTAMHGEAALTFLARQEVDVVLLDVEMPVMDGLAALEQIQKRFPDVRVIMVSGHTQEGADVTVRALGLGAAGCVAKPMGRNASESIATVSKELIPLITALGGKSRRSLTGQSVFKAPSTFVPTRIERAMIPRVVVIGSSTGGPQALRTVLTQIPVDFPLPILIVQHMPPMFTPMLARHLEKDTGRPTSEGAPGMPVLGGHTYVAPGDYHMQLVRRSDQVTLELTQAPQEHFCRPSVNPLFRSAASLYGSGVAALMLTGMGEDGLEGSREVASRGGWIVAQDETSSVVWGMPGAIVKAGLAQEILPLEEIAPALLRRCLQETCRS